MQKCSLNNSKEHRNALSSYRLEHTPKERVSEGRGREVTRFERNPQDYGGLPLAGSTCRRLKMCLGLRSKMSAEE